MEEGMPNELGNRFQKAWRHYSPTKTTLQQTVPTKTPSLHSAVIPYDCTTWTLKQTDLKKLRVDQWKMLRMMIGINRRVIDSELRDAHSETEDDDTDDCDDDCAVDEGDEDEKGNNVNASLKDWVSWVQRTTRIAEDELQKANVTDRVREQRQRYWSHCPLHWFAVVLGDYNLDTKRP